jgi:hypothetical protein
MEKRSKIVFIIAFVVFFSVAVVKTATAKNTLAVVNGQANSAANKVATTTTGQANTTTGQTTRVQKLTEAKLKVCQNKEGAIQKRNNALTKMANTMLTKFDSIATRVETYYTGTVVPSGKTVSNYSALVADIAAKKSAVQKDLDKASIDDTAFNCTSDDPKGQLTQFRTDMQAVKQGLKDYRTSIKNLIVAIRSVTGTTESTSNSTVN